MYVYASVFECSSLLILLDVFHEAGENSFTFSNHLAPVLSADNSSFPY